MNPEKFAFTVAVVVFAAGSLGIILHHALPEKHVTGGARDMIGAVVGLLTLLSALVLGLLIWTSYAMVAVAAASACFCASVEGWRLARD